MKELVVPAGEKKHLILVHDNPEKEERVIRLAGKGAEVRVDEVFCTGNVKSSVTIVHDAECTVSRVYARGVVGKKEETRAHAIVIIPEHAQLCDTFLSQKFLLLDEQAHVDARPSLEIEADDVKASHAASVSSLDENQLFYAMSRGLSREEAKKLIIEGFLGIPEQWQK